MTEEITIKYQPIWKARKVIDHICEICGIKFRAGTNALTCSNKCRTKKRWLKNKMLKKINNKGKKKLVFLKGEDV